MATKTRTDAEMVEVLATKGADPSLNASSRKAFAIRCLTDLNAVHEVQERLTDKQWANYREALRSPDWPTLPSGLSGWKANRHASARTCCEALVEVLSAEEGVM